MSDGRVIWCVIYFILNYLRGSVCGSCAVVAIKVGRTVFKKQRNRSGERAGGK